MEVPTGAADHGISKLEGNVWPARPSRSDAWSDAWGMQPRPPALACASRLAVLVAPLAYSFYSACIQLAQLRGPLRTQALSLPARPSPGTGGGQRESQQEAATSRGTRPPCLGDRLVHGARGSGSPHRAAFFPLALTLAGSKGAGLWGCGVRGAGARLGPGPPFPVSSAPKLFSMLVARSSL